MLYRDLLELIHLFAGSNYYSALKKTILIIRFAQESLNEEGLMAKIRETDKLLKPLRIPNCITLQVATNHALIMEQIFHGV